MLVMQRLSENDPSGHLLSKKGKSYKHYKLPAELIDGPIPADVSKNYVNGLLDPIRISANAIEEAKSDLGSFGYAGQFSQSPAPATGAIWKKWFIPIKDDEFPSAKRMIKYGTDWDLAYTKEETNAANAFVTAGKIGPNVYIDNIGFDWLEFPDLIKYMKQQPGPHYIEAKASGKSAKQTLSAEGIIAIEVKVDGGDKVARARMSTPIAEAGMVYVRQSLLDKLYNDPRQGILAFPKGKFKDLADALGQCLQRLKKKGFTVAGTSSRTTDRASDLLNDINFDD
jgi:phage terminase large subunit-like protein